MYSCKTHRKTFKHQWCWGGINWACNGKPVTTLKIRELILLGGGNFFLFVDIYWKRIECAHQYSMNFPRAWGQSVSSGTNDSGKVLMFFPLNALGMKCSCCKQLILLCLGPSLPAWSASYNSSYNNRNIIISNTTLPHHLCLSFTLHVA